MGAKPAWAGWDGLPFLAHVTDVPCTENRALFTRLGEDGAALHASAVRAGRAVCWSCPVRRACAEHALTTGETWGMWGGTTAPERAREANRRRVARRRAQRLAARVAQMEEAS